MERRNFLRFLIGSAPALVGGGALLGAAADTGARRAARIVRTETTGVPRDGWPSHPNCRCTLDEDTRFKALFVALARK